MSGTDRQRRTYDAFGAVALADGNADNFRVEVLAHPRLARQDPKESPGRMTDQCPRVAFLIQPDDPIITGERTEEANFQARISTAGNHRRPAGYRLHRAIGARAGIGDFDRPVAQRSVLCDCIALATSLEPVRISCDFEPPS